MKWDGIFKWGFNEKGERKKESLKRGVQMTSPFQEQQQQKRKQCCQLQFSEIGFSNSNLE